MSWRQTLRQDREALEQGRSFPATDRYLALIYPQLATAADYLPPDACVLFSESSRVGERAKTWQWQLEEDAKSLMERGELDGSCGVLSRTYARSCTARLSDWPMAYLDSFTSVRLSGGSRCVLSGDGQAAALLRGQPGDSGRRPEPLSARRAWPPWCWCPANSGP
ncbi:MAG: hypothetical protein ACLRWQ_00810 [Flavonifractor plautii]